MSTEYKCNTCNKYYKTYQTLWKHNKKFHDVNKLIPTHSNTIPAPGNTIPAPGNTIPALCNTIPVQKHNCKYCNKIFSRNYSVIRHEKTCKVKDKNDLDKLTEIKKLELELKKEEFKILQLKLKLEKSTKIDSEIDDQVKHEQPINNQLINIIVDKNKTIEELTTKINNESIVDNKILGKPLIEFYKLTLNDVIIISRIEDNYINATQLCQAGNRQFNDWYRLNTTKQLINEAESETGIPVSQLVDIKKGNSTEFNQGSWVHPDLAIQLAQWLSPKFALQVSKWIRTLLTDGQVELLKNKDDEIKLNKQKIQLLEDTYIKQQKRKSYPTKNVIYMLTTEDHKKNRLYIIGKACNLKNRLGN